MDENLLTKIPEQQSINHHHDQSINQYGQLFSTDKDKFGGFIQNSIDKEKYGGGINDKKEVVLDFYQNRINYSCFL